MKNSSQPSVAPVTVLAALAVILLVLAGLQYRWISQVSEVDRERIQAGLENSVRQFRQEFNRELLNLCLASQPRLGPGPASSEDWGRVVERFDNWLQVAPYPSMVAHLYVWESEDEQPAQILELNRNSKSFEPTTATAALEKLRARLDQFDLPRRRLWFGEGRVFLWDVVDGTPMILHPIRGRAPRENPRTATRPSGFLLIELDPAVLRNVVLPELAQRYFRGPEGFEYQVAVLDEENPGELVYRSSDDLTAASFRTADIRTSLLWTPRDFVERFEGEGRRGFPGPPPDGLDRRDRSDGPDNRPDRRNAPPGADAPPPRPREGGPFEKGPPREGFRGLRGEPVLINIDERGWDLAAKHPQGSLDSAVASLRRRNLAISFGVLMLLAASVGMIYVSAQRSRRLADLQMEFVAGVSHELRTPLAVIRSAADNLADGVVESRPQVKEYGLLIGREGRRLTTMIEQTLQFASSQNGSTSYELGAVSLESVVDRTLRDLKPAVEESGFEIETRIEPGLPAVRSNEEALSRVLSNLVQNALKYGGDGNWLAVRASLGHANGSREIELSVEDRGPGIDSEDLAHIFEPFYRGKLALSQQIQGSGLGLNLAQRISRAIGARLTVDSRPGKGSTFVVHLPVEEKSLAGKA